VDYGEDYQAVSIRLALFGLISIGVVVLILTESGI
jgi:hypothetical protein